MQNTERVIELDETIIQELPVELIAAHVQRLSIEQNDSDFFLSDMDKKLIIELGNRSLEDINALLVQAQERKRNA